MLHLQAGIHFQKIELTALIQELHGTRARVTDAGGGAHGCRAHRRPRGIIQTRGRCLFDQLLMTTLHRAVAFMQMHAVAMVVGKHLDLHMPGLGQVFLQQHARVTKRRPGFALHRRQGLLEFHLGMDHPQAATTPTGNGFQQHRITGLISRLAQHRDILRIAMVTRQHGHIGFGH